MLINLPKSKNRKIYVFAFYFFIFSNILVNAQVGIGNSNPDASSILDMTSVTQGLLTPRMTSLERDAILNPAKGLLIYNTTTSNFNYFDLVWKRNSENRNHYNSNADNDVVTTSIVDIAIPEMTIAPVLAGTYEVLFNCSYNNSPTERIVSSGESFPSTMTQEAKSDLELLIDELNSLTVTNSNHAAVFGNGETISSGIYYISGAASIAGNLTLDGSGDSNSIFVIKTNGALVAGANTNVTLTNGAQARNVFWLAYGSPSFGANSIMKGNVIVGTAGDISFNAGGNLEGRLLTISGEITLGSAIVSKPIGTSAYTLGTLADFVLYTAFGTITNVAVSTIIGNIGSDSGSIIGFELATVNGAFATNATYISVTSTTIFTANTNNIVASFSIYQNGVLIPSSSTKLTSEANFANASLQAFVTLEANQIIDVRWRTASDKIGMGSRTLTLIKVQ
jgi:hypothetical protein